MPKLLIATSNRGKLEEIQALLADLPVILVTPADLGLKLHVEETGDTYAENAALKAQAYAQASGLPTLADDSGLEVAALDGAPGLYSARYAPQENATDADRRAYLLANLKGFSRPWDARFICVVALTYSGGDPVFYEGICPGEIIPEERGTNGFGYDPIFLVENTSLTMAELPMAEKNTLSHRARAVMAARVAIEKL
ncbi:MAG: RdgB/HAM1 family non-canonical purine NTP pyrophosphatase [Chloroflexi bacterium]|nr:RdgB/HAM1 family non-canonical purine NTP pyrophosphatase [Chloroflexota bacterium]